MPAALLSVEFLDELVDGVRNAALPLIRRDLGLSYSQLGLLSAVPQILGSVLELPLGLLASGSRRRRLVLSGGLGFALALALIAVAPGFAPLVAAFVLFFVSAGAFVSLSQAAVMDADVDGREHNMARWTLSGTFGSLAGPLTVAAVATVGGSWRPVFGALALATLVTLVAVARQPVLVDTQPPRPLAANLRRALAALRDASVMRWLLLIEVSDLLLDVLTAFAAIYLVDEVGASPAQAALGITLRLAAQVAGQVALVAALRRHSWTVLIRASAVAAAVLYPAFLLLPGLMAKLAALTLLSAVTTPWYPLVAAQLYRVLPDDSGIAVSLGTVTSIAAGVLPAAIGLAAQAVGLPAALAALGIAPLVLLVAVPGRKEALDDGVRDRIEA